MRFNRLLSLNALSVGLKYNVVVLWGLFKYYKFMLYSVPTKQRLCYLELYLIKYGLKALRIT